MVDPFADLASVRGTVVLDGGLATVLERRGFDLSDTLWSARVLLEDPSSIFEIHRAYFAAGADVAIGASYQASFEGFAARGIDRGRAAEALRLSVAIAREAADEVPRPTLLAASVGPYGAMLADGSEYRGDYAVSVDHLVRFHVPRMEALASAGPDLFAVETIPALAEAEAIAQALERVPEVPAWVTFSCRDARRLHDGTPIERAVALVAGSEQVVAIGVNCTPSRFVSELIGRIRASTGKPIVVYPNAGGEWSAGSRRWDMTEVPELGQAAPGWRDEGAAAIGGCCGTGPDQIAAIAAALAA
jgi:homocysteine S-methyltransferase